MSRPKALEPKRHLAGWAAALATIAAAATPAAADPAPESPGDAPCVVTVEPANARVEVSRGRLVPIETGRRAVYHLADAAPGEEVELAVGAYGYRPTRRRWTLRRRLDVVAVRLEALPERPTRRAAGRLAVHARPWALCSVRGQRQRWTTPFYVDLEPGLHEVRCEQGPERARRLVRVIAAGTRELFFDFSRR